MLNLKNCRIKRDIKQIDVCKALNIAQNTYSQYESGKREPDNKTLTKIADYFNVSVDYILGRTEESGKLNPLDITKIYTSSPDIERINVLLNRLNPLGLQKTTDYVTDLLDSPKYVKNTDISAPIQISENFDADNYGLAAMEKTYDHDEEDLKTT